MSIQFKNLLSKPHVFKLSHKVIQLKGSEAVQYLNSQTTNNINDLQVNSFGFGTLLDRVGKIVSAFVICRESEEDLYLIVTDNYIGPTIERIEQFHISEDFEIKLIEKTAYLLTRNSNENGYVGKYFFENDSILISDQKLEQSDNRIWKELKVLTGVPELGQEVKPGELVNNTYFDELAVDYQKGCFLGQETVAKINTRRGAAYKPVLLKLEKVKSLESGELLIDGKKVGKILNSMNTEEATCAMGYLAREYRLDKGSFEFEQDGKKFSATVFYYPYLPTTNKEVAQVYYDGGIASFQNGNYDEAVQSFNQAIEINPSFEDAYESLGVLFGRLEQYDKAIELMEKLKELNPKCMMAYTNLSLYHMKLGNIETAEKYKSDATVLNFEILGDEAQRKRKEEELKAQKITEQKRRLGMYKQVLEIDPVDAMANYGLGEIELENENFEVAIKYFRNAIEGDSKYSVAYLGLGKCYYQLSKSMEAKETLEKGIKIATKNGDLMPANEMQRILTKISS